MHSLIVQALRACRLQHLQATRQRTVFAESASEQLSKRSGAGAISSCTCRQTHLVLHGVAKGLGDKVAERILREMRADLQQKAYFRKGMGGRGWPRAARQPSKFNDFSSAVCRVRIDNAKVRPDSDTCWMPRTMAMAAVQSTPGATSISSSEPGARFCIVKELH